MQKLGDNAGKTKGLNILNENQPLIQISDDGVTHAFFEWQQIASKIWVHCSIKQSSLHAAIVVVSNLIFFNLPRIWMVTEFEKNNERSLASYETWEFEVGTHFRPPNRNFHTLTHEVCKKNPEVFFHWNVTFMNLLVMLDCGRRLTRFLHNYHAWNWVVDLS